MFEYIIPYERKCVNKNMKGCSYNSNGLEQGAGNGGGTYRKVYVSVNLDVDEEGAACPRLIRWGNGRVFQIEQLRHKCRASSQKVGGGGIRYTVVIRGKEAFLFQEGGKWFVEAKEGRQ